MIIIDTQCSVSNTYNETASDVYLFVPNAQ